jgi:predicted dehydrogenase
MMKMQNKKKQLKEQEPGQLKVGIVGCGLIGKKRAKNLLGQKLVFVCDNDLEKAKALASEYSCKYTDDFKDIVKSDVDIVIVSTPNNMLVPVALEAVKHGKHVLIEKPGARNPDEMKKLIDAVEKNNNLKVKVGFNHRFHPAILKAKELIMTDNSLGNIMFIRASYGHGGRLGYDKEWRAKKEISGGGELLDQGCHLIDLGRLFLGDFVDSFGFAPTYFWDMKMEDNGFAFLRTKKGQIMQFHASWTEWKNLFSFEIMLRNAKIEINGLGGSYGIETLIFYKMKPEMGIPDKQTFTFEGEDKSWELEFEELVDAIKNNKKLSDLEDAYKCLQIIYHIYDCSEKNKLK